MSKAFAYAVGFVAALALVIGIYGATRTIPEPKTSTSVGASLPGTAPYCTTAPADGGPPFGCPSSWSQASWFVDRQNTSTCASDSNVTCGQSTCTAGVPGIADGPCLSATQIVARWGTSSPHLRQNTTIKWLSGETGNTDVDTFYPSPILENQASLFLTGTPTTVATGTLGTVVSKVISTSPVLLQAVLTPSSGSVAVGEFLVNTTHAGNAWIYTNVSGSNYSLSQPLPAASTEAIGTGIPFGTTGSEQNSFTAGDSYTIETFPEVNIASINPTIESWNAANFGGGVYVSNLQIIGPGHGNSPPLVIGASVLLGEVSITGRLPTGNASTIGGPQGNSTNFGYSQEFYNVWSGAAGGEWPMGFPVSATANNSASFFVAGGVFTGGGMFRLGNVNFQQDSILGSAAHAAFFINQGTIGSLYVDTGEALALNVGAVSLTSTLWGPGGMTVNQNARLSYPSGAGAAVANILIQGAITVAGTKGCAVIPTDAGNVGPCNETFSATNLDAVLGATGGCISVPGSGSMCNIGQ